jgi:ferredoxin
MPIATSRTNENAQIFIDEQKCSGCGRCVAVCKDFSLEMVNRKAQVSETPFFGCFACGQCMAVCPEDAIEISGRTISPKDIFPLPARENSASYAQLNHLLERRRSVRDFKDKAVEAELLSKVIEAAETAPMGIPPSDVNLLILENKAKVRAFATGFCAHLKNIKWMTSGWFLALMRPFWGKSTDEMFRGFLKPLIEGYIKSMDDDANFVTYDAPAAIYFYGSPFADPADPIIPATYAMLAAESLGLATCMIGGVHPFIQHGSSARRFREKHNIRFRSKEGVIVLMGYPEIKYKKGIRRTFANIDYLN